MSHKNPGKVERYFQFAEFFAYFLRVFRKHDGKYPMNFNLRMMHGINRISIVMFLFCLTVIIVRRLFF